MLIIKTGIFPLKKLQFAFSLPFLSSPATVLGDFKRCIAFIDQLSFSHLTWKTTFPQNQSEARDCHYFLLLKIHVNKPFQNYKNILCSLIPEIVSDPLGLLSYKCYDNVNDCSLYNPFGEIKDVFTKQLV